MVINIESPLIGADYWFEKLKITDRLGNPLLPGDKVLVPTNKSSGWGQLSMYYVGNFSCYPQYGPTALYLEHRHPDPQFQKYNSRHSIDISELMKNSIKIK
jgi:hypothetical protein